MDKYIEERERKKRLARKRFGVEDIIEGLVDLYQRNYFKVETEPRFSIQEFAFLAELILKKEKGFIVIRALDYISENCLEGGLGFPNTASFRRLVFYQNFLGNKGNATKAAIAAGYSPRSARQSGYRALKWIQKQANTRV